MPDINSFKKAVKWLFCDKVVIFFAVVGAILLLVTLTVFAEGVDSIRYWGVEYDAGARPASRIFFKMTTPALVVNILLKGYDAGTIPYYIIRFFLMFAIQIVAYGIVGKVASAFSSGRIVAVCMCVGVVILALALAYQINPTRESVFGTVKGKPFELFLMLSNLPTLLFRQCLLGVFGKTALLYIILYPSMFIVQIFLYGCLGRLIKLPFPD